MLRIYEVSICTSCYTVLAAPAWAVDVMMGADGNLVFDPEVIFLQENLFTL